MTDLFGQLLLGFSAVVTVQNLLLCFTGVLLGTFIGVLPGIGPLPTISMLLPLTYGMDPLSGLIMIAGIFYGSQYGGSTTAILVNLPGESGSVVTCIDGHRMAKKGRAGQALAIAAIGSFIAGTIATLVIALIGPTLAEMATRFSAPEYVALMVLGLVCVVVLAQGSVLKALGMTVVGLILGLAGTDAISGMARFTFGSGRITDGIDFVALAVGLFGVAEIIRNLEQPEARTIVRERIGSLHLPWPLFCSVLPAMLRGSGMGSALGMLPGGGPILSSFASYALEKKLSKTPDEFGNGAPAGVAAPEAANNAAAQTSFIPLLTMGLPTNALMALLMSALVMKGITPGPNVMTDHPELFWGLIASMWIGNLMLVIINLPLVGLWVSMLRIPYHWLFPAILLACCIGVYSLNASWLDVLLVAGFGLAGYVLLRLRCEPAPLVLGFVLGPMLEENLRRALLVSRGDPAVFLNRPISAAVLLLAVIVLVLPALPFLGRLRQRAFAE